VTEQRAMMTLYGDLRSGNTLKVKWTADLLGVPYTVVEVDAFMSATRQPEYLAKFPMGQAPGIELPDGRCLAQSNAICRYLANGTDLLPAHPFQAAKVDEWLFWEQYSHEPYVAVLYTAVAYRGVALSERDSHRVQKGEQALDLMETWLSARDFFVADRFTIADIALFAYTRFAERAGFDMKKRPHVEGWLQRCGRKIGA
jgi:glutathione S-transferase